MPTTHATSLTNGEIVEETDLGSMRRVTADNLPILSGCRSSGCCSTPARCAPRTGTPTATSSPTACPVPPWFGARRRQQVLQLHRHRRPDVPYRFRLAAPHREHRRGRRRVHLAFRSERPEDFGLAPPSARSATPCWATLTTCPPQTSPRSTATPPTISWPPASATRLSLRPRTSMTHTSSTSRPEAAGRDRRRQRPGWPASSTGPPSRTCRCTRCASAKTGCANRTGTRSPPKWVTSSRRRRG